jgi:hypothetical protein
MVRLRLYFDWWNVKHIARHDIDREEVEETCYGNPLIQKGFQGRISVIGPTLSGRMLKVILKHVGNEKHYVVTAYEANTQEEALYQKLKGGDKNEKN